MRQGWKMGVRYTCPAATDPDERPTDTRPVLGSRRRLDGGTDRSNRDSDAHLELVWMADGAVVGIWGFCGCHDKMTSSRSQPNKLASYPRSKEAPPDRIIIKIWMDRGKYKSCRGAPSGLLLERRAQWIDGTDRLSMNQADRLATYESQSINLESAHDTHHRPS